jgi:predicted alpha/beta superfamily hydrolase
MLASVRASLEQFTLAHPSGAGALKISVAAPAIPMSVGPVPVLYVMDGDLLFGLAAEIARAMSAAGGMPALYIVGIGYDAGYADFLKLRTADLSPPITAQALEALGAVATAISGDRNGGADRFLQFLLDALAPQMAARFPQTVGAARFLFGHSLGGLFAAHALVTRPEAFDAFLVSSPSLWWDDFSIFRKLPAFPARLAALAARPRVFLDVGGKEQDLPTTVPEGLGVSLEEARAQIRAARMVDAAGEFAEALREAGIESLRHITFAEDDHTSVVPAAILHGMRFALPTDR